MGRDTIAADGERTVDDNLARAQVILRHICGNSRRQEEAVAGLQGSLDNVDYDFASVPHGLEPFFALAGDSEDAPSAA
jgi:hypothetical protein